MTAGRGDAAVPAVWLGDAVRAIDRLRPSGPTAARIAAMLDLRPPSPGPPTLPLIAPPGTLPGVAVSSAPLRQDVEQPLRSGAIGVALRGPAPEEPAIVERDSATRIPEPPRPLPHRRTLLPDVDPLVLGPTSLLSAGQRRALLGALCARPTPSGELDLDVLVERLASRQPVRTLPRRPIRTMRRGLQLLVDFGEGMRGFQHDRDEVWDDIGRLAGADGIEVLRFAGTPLEPPGAGPGLRRTWRRYEPPAWGRPVLVLSDLGTGIRPAERKPIVDGWLAFAERTRAAGCPVTALVPSPLARIPFPLRRALSPVTWDRRTTVRDAAAAARLATGRLPDVTG